MIEKCGQFALRGDIYVENGKVYSRVPICIGVRLCYFLPSAKVKNGISAMRPLVLHKIDGYLRHDTKEILILNKNQEYHFSLFLTLQENEKDSNCFLDTDSSIITTKFISPQQELKCFKATWSKIDTATLPQYAVHCQLQQKYAFKRKKDCMIIPTPKQEKRIKSTESELTIITRTIQNMIEKEEYIENRTEEEIFIDSMPKEEECLTQERLFKLFDMYFGEIN